MTRIDFRKMDEDDLAWLQARTNAVPARDVTGVVAEIEGVRSAVVAAERWSETAAWLHLTIDDPRTLENNQLLDEIARYVFDERGREFIFTTVSSLNAPSLRFQKALGFVKVGHLEDAFDYGEDMIILRLDAPTWRDKRHE